MSEPITTTAAIRTPDEVNALVEANLGLVRLMLGRTRHHSRHEHALLSAGHVALWRAAQLFDESLGFTFSTYATCAIKRRMRSVLCRDHTPAAVSLDAALAMPAGNTPRPIDVLVRREELQQAERLVDALPPVRAEVVRRVLLGEEKGKAVAADLGVTTTRVYQIRNEAALAMREAAENPAPVVVATPADMVASCNEVTAPTPSAPPVPALPVANWTPPQDLQLLTPEDVAKMLSLSIRTIWRLAERGDLPEPIRLGRRIVRWRRGDLLAWLDGCGPTHAAKQAEGAA